MTDRSLDGTYAGTLADFEPEPLINEALQLFPPLSETEYASLKADIQARGILIPIEVDQAGNVVDGFHRIRVARELGIEPPLIVRTFTNEQERLAHIIALNLKRRHLDPVTWGEMFMRYAEARGIRVGIQGRQDEKTDTVSVLATELGVNERTARRRLAAARLPEALREQVRSGERTVRTATQEVHRQERRRSYWQKCNRCTFS